MGRTPLAVAIADLNHDGYQDMIVANDGDGTLTVLLGNGKGAFRPAPGSPFAAGGRPMNREPEGAGVRSPAPLDR